MKRKIIVIGGVAAGPSSASKAKRVNPDAEIVLYEQGEYISYGVCEIPYFISNEITDPAKLQIYSPERLQKEKGVNAYTLHRAEEIIPSKREVRIHDLRTGKTFTDHYDKLIIATGCSSKRLEITGEENRNVFHIKSLEHAYALKKYIDEEKPRSAVIIGAGFIGLEMADALSRRGMEVSFVHQSPLPMSIMEEPTRKIILDELHRNRMQYIPNASVEWFGVGSKMNVVAVGLKNQTIETDLVIVAIGVKPNTQLAGAAGIHIGNSGGILTSDRMNALGADNVYAAGDCCELRNIVTKKPFYLSLATTATKTGWIAGENAAGGNVQFKGTIRAIGVRVFNLEIAQAGLTMKEAIAAGFHPVISTITSSSKVGMMPGNSPLHITTIADKKSGKLLGANIAGKEGAIQRANVLSVAIRHGLTMSDIAEFDMIYSPPFSPLWDGILISGQQGKKLL